MTRCLNLPQKIYDLLMFGKPFLRCQRESPFDERHIDSSFMSCPPGRPCVRG